MNFIFMQFTIKLLKQYQMKLARALILRKDYGKNLEQLETRIEDNCKVQEGEVSSDDPEELVELYLQMSAKMKKLISNINLTNFQLMFNFGSVQNLNQGHQRWPREAS